MRDVMHDVEYWRWTAGEAATKIDRLRTRVEGYERLLTRLTRERDQARAERDTADRQATRLIEEVGRARRRVEADGEWLRQFGKLVEGAIDIVLHTGTVPADGISFLEEVCECARQTRERGEQAVTNGSLAQPAEAPGSNPAQSRFESEASYTPGWIGVAEYLAKAGYQAKVTSAFCGVPFSYRAAGCLFFVCERPDGHDGRHGIPRWALEAAE